MEQKKHNHNSTELRPGDELRLQLANKNFPPEWVIIAKREAEEAARKAAEQRLIAEQIDGLGQYETKLAPFNRSKEISPEQETFNEVKKHSSKIVAFRTQEVDDRNRGLMAA